MGFKPTIPQAAAGILIDPPVSVPIEARHIPAATAAAEPPLDPPGDRDVACGFFVGPNAESSDVVPNANSCRLHLPTRITPAWRSALTISASVFATCPWRTKDAAVVGRPRTSIKSFSEIGMP